MRSTGAALPFSVMAGRVGAQADGLRIGLQTWVFTANTNVPRDRAVDACIETMTATGMRECDVCAPLLDPPEIVNRIPPLGRGQSPATPEAAALRAAAQKELAAWRATTPLEHYAAIRKRFNDAGIEIYALSLFPSATPELLTRTMDVAEALGAKLIASAANLSVLKTLAPLVERRGLTLGIQGRADMNATDPDVVAKPDQYVAAAALASHCRIVMDIGDATGRGWDTLSFVRDHGDKIAVLYIKDRRRDNTSVPFGEGDTPIRDVLRVIRDRRYPIRCYIDCDYPSDDRAGDVKRSLEFMRATVTG